MNQQEILEAVSELLETDEPAGLGPQRRAAAGSEGEVRGGAQSFLAAGDLDVESRELILSALLLWHDHLESSHVLSQNIPGSSGSFLHGIMHRREPDYGNAKYWFNRTGEHPAFPEIARRAGELLDQGGDRELKRRLMEGGRWDPFAMVDAVADAEAGKLPPAQVELLKTIQKIEIEVLIEFAI